MPAVTRSAMSSKSVGSRLMMINREPLRLASKGNPAAGQTTSEEPMTRKRSQSRLAASARFIAGTIKDGEKVTISGDKLGLTFNGKLAQAA